MDEKSKVSPEPEKPMTEPAQDPTVPPYQELQEACDQACRTEEDRQLLKSQGSVRLCLHAVAEQSGQPVERINGLSPPELPRRKVLGLAKGALIFLAGGTASIAFQHLTDTSRVLDDYDEWYRRNAGYQRRDNPSEEAWKQDGEKIRDAIKDRDFNALREMRDSTPHLSVRKFLDTTIYGMTGQVGRAYAELTDKSVKDWVTDVPDYMKHDFLIGAARQFSVAGYAERSLEMYALLKKTGWYHDAASSTDKTKATGYVRVAREEVNHALQTVHSREEYYGRGGRVLDYCRDRLKEVEHLTGTDLYGSGVADESVRVATIVMRDYLDWNYAYGAGHKKDADRLLRKQLEGIRRLCDFDWRVGNMRFTPLVAQAVRSGEWRFAEEAHAEQLKRWNERGENLGENHRYEYALSLALEGVIQGRGFRRYDAALKSVDKAAALFRSGSNKTVRFQRALGQLGYEFAKHLSLGRDKLSSYENQAKSGADEGGYYYFFGDLGTDHVSTPKH